MIHTDDKTKEIRRRRREKGERFLSDARLLHEKGRYESSVNRAYFAVHSAAKSLLILTGNDPESHEDVERELAALQVPAIMAESFGILRKRREAADYGDAAPGAHEAGDSIARAEEFLRQAAMEGEKYLA